ncbi:hypothetical protein QA601_15530 [Chitinispirillales bacterium ANBcel5]|uniref:hypothetical protein n=1 Tax=Cellulosispirillum alkaliphilum TaxID=3039283 RepID=UPI002A50A605|nr:hypothetical protein [Chitinispirillales bacterium ANBcel5]
MALTHADLDWSVAPPPVKRKDQKKHSEETEAPPKFITGVEGDGRDEEEEHEPEVRIISAEWKPGPKGFQHNEQCFLAVKVKYLKKTIRAKIRGKLFGTYDGEEEDLAQTVEGFIEDDDVALLNIEHLWFMGLRHYNAWREDNSTPSQYQIKQISHSRGENTIDSPVLELPLVVSESVRVRLPVDPNREEFRDDTYRLFSTDANRSYDVVKTVEDDKIPGNDYLDLEYTDLDPSLSYTLEIIPGKEGKKYFAFKNIAYKELTGVS